jgi:hypothetical protein
VMLWGDGFAESYKDRRVTRRRDSHASQSVKQEPLRDKCKVRNGAGLR